MMEPLYLPEWPQTYFDLHDNHSVELGTHLAYTPSIRIMEEPHGGSRIVDRRRHDLSLPAAGQRAVPGLTIGAEFFGDSERVEHESGFRQMFAPAATLRRS